MTGYSNSDIIVYVGTGILILVLWILFRRMFVESEEQTPEVPAEKNQTPAAQRDQSADRK